MKNSLRLFLGAIGLTVALTAYGDTADLSKGMLGHWRTQCSVASGFSQSSIDDYVTQEDGSGLQTTTYYADLGCTQPVISQEWTYAQTLGDDVRAGLKKIDLSYTAVSVTALTEAGKTVLETYGYCGLTAWPVNEKQDMTSRSGTSHCMIKIPYTDYTVISIIGDRLYLGKFAGNPNDRASDVSMDWHLIRVP